MFQKSQIQIGEANLHRCRNVLLNNQVNEIVSDFFSMDFRKNVGPVTWWEVGIMYGCIVCILPVPI